jgi:hypothetical protein
MGEITMPAVSKKQRMAAGMAKAIQAGEMPGKPGMPATEMAQSMKPAVLNEFAGTPQKGLPMQAKPPGSKERQQDVVGGQKKPWGWEAPKSSKTRVTRPTKSKMYVRQVGQPVIKKPF